MNQRESKKTDTYSQKDFIKREEIWTVHLKVGKNFDN